MLKLARIKITALFVLQVELPKVETKFIPSRWTPNFPCGRPGGDIPLWPPATPPCTPFTPPTTPRQTAANCIVTLQICSGNQLGLTWAGGLTTGMIRILGGSPLVTWERDESRITMKAEDYAPIVASIQPFFFSPLFFLPPLVPSVPAVSQPLKRYDCWRQKPEDGRVWREE